jgi:hypothetical protein
VGEAVTRIWLGKAFDLPTQSHWLSHRGWGHYRGLCLGYLQRLDCSVSRAKASANQQREEIQQ